MKRTPRRSILCLGFFVAGCVVTGGRLQARLDTWIGESVHVLENSWGQPTERLSSPTGDSVYVYRRMEAYTGAGATPVDSVAAAVATRAKPNEIMKCEVRFRVHDETIMTAGFTGQVDMCPNQPAPG